MNPINLCTGHKLIDRELSLAQTFSKGFYGDVNTNTRTKFEEIRHRLRRRIDPDCQTLGNRTTFDVKVIRRT